MSVHIPAVVSGSYINCDNYVAGAQGSFNDVILRVKLTGDWIIGGSATKSIVASFVDAHGRTASAVIVLPSMAVPGEENTYDIPIPAAAKQYEGDISVVLSGYDQSISTGGYQDFAGTGSQKVFAITNVTPVPDVIINVFIDNIAVAPSEYTYDSTTGNVTFRLAPENGDTVKVVYKDRVITQITRTANCFMRVLSSDFVIVDGSELDTDIVTQINAEITALDGRVTTVEADVDSFDADFASKADKVSAAVSGHFAGLDANGNLTDSGSKASDFLPANAFAEKAEVILPIDYIQDTAPVDFDEGEYWFNPDEGRLFYSAYRSGSYVWDDVTEEKLKTNNIFITGNGQVYYSPFEGDLYAAKAVPTGHSHTVSDISNFSSGISGKADKVGSATSGDLAKLNSSGNLVDAGFAIPAPTLANAGKFLKVDAYGNFYYGGPKSAYTISISGQGGSPTACYVQDNNSTEKHYEDSDSFGIADGYTITVSVNYSASNNWIKLNGAYVANPGEGAAVYTFAPVGNCAIAFDISVGSYGHVTITQS